MSYVKLPDQISRRLIAGALIVCGSLMLMGYFKMPDRDPVEAQDPHRSALQKTVPASVPDWVPASCPMDATYVQFSPFVETAYAGVPQGALQAINCAPVSAIAGTFDAGTSNETARTRFMFAHDIDGTASNGIFAATLSSKMEPLRVSGTVNVPCVEFLHGIVCP